jgi:tetratricopeptide (TPR) repeat protein
MLPLPPQTEPVSIEEQVDHWVAEHKYADALNLLGDISIINKEYANLIKKKQVVLEKAEVYSKEILQIGKELEKQGRIGEAENQYVQGLTNYPQSNALTSALNNLQAKQSEKLKILSRETLITDAIWLERTLTLYSEIFRLKTPTRLTERQYNEQQHKAKMIAQELAGIGSVALDQGNLKLAGRTIPLALKLLPSPENKQLNKKLNDVINRQKNKIKQADKRASEKSKKDQQNALKEQQNTLLNELGRAINDHNLIEAQQLLSRLEKDEGNTESLSELQIKLKQLVDKKVELHLAQGIELYSEGEYQQAINIWRQVLVLDPENEQLKTHIERAERVISKLQELREKQTHGE